MSLRQRIENDEFAVTCELNPPKGIRLDSLFEKAEKLRGLVHAYNLTESHAARMAMDPVAAAHLLLDQGFEPIVQMTSRDKNRIALQAGMLAAAALGIKNLVFMGGDPPANGDHPEAKPVFDLFASQLLEAASALNGGADFNGNPLNQATDFFLGSVVNPGAADLQTELSNMRRKIDGGARFLQTQAVYSADDFERFLERAGDVPVPILAGIIPIKSVAMANYLNERVPGIQVPDRLIQKIASLGGDRDAIAAASTAISASIIEKLHPLAGGIHIMAIGWEDKIPAILAAAGLDSGGAPQS